MDSMSKAFAYISGILDSVSRAGKALSEWKETAPMIQQPTCAFITDENMTKVENLMIKLYKCSVPSMKRGWSLWPLAHCLFATTLMTLNEMMFEYPSNQVITAINRAAQECDISTRELLQYKKIWIALS